MDSLQTSIDAIISRFYSAFSNAVGVAPVDTLYDVCLPEALIINATNETPAIYSLRGFVEPRRALLNGGTLSDFREYETANDTEVHERIARRTSQYEKTWREPGIQKSGSGTKIFSLVLMPAGWKIASVLWRDVT